MPPPNLPLILAGSAQTPTFKPPCMILASHWLHTLFSNAAASHQHNMPFLTNSCPQTTIADKNQFELGLCGALGRSTLILAIYMVAVRLKILFMVESHPYRCVEPVDPSGGLHDCLHSDDIPPICKAVCIVVLSELWGFLRMSNYDSTLLLS